MSKDEALVQKLMGVLKGARPEDVDKLINEAKCRLAKTTKKFRRWKYSTLFDAQLQTLQDRGCPEAILKAFRSQKNSVIDKVCQMKIAGTNIPFLPIIPKPYGSLYFQVPMVRKGGKSGDTRLDLSQITDVVSVPSAPYYIFNVEDGWATLGKTPREATKLIKKRGRRGLTDTEVIALGIHTDVLSTHFVHAVGSRYGSDEVPELYLSKVYGSEPRLDLSRLDSNFDILYGTASCDK